MKIRNLAITLALTASAVFANDHLNQIAGTAKELQSDFSMMAQTLKNKNFAAEELKRELEALRGHVDQLKATADEFEAANPSLSGQHEKDWKLAKELIALVDIFHSQKAEMLNGDNPAKNRKMLKAQAEGLAKRSTVLRETALRLAQSLSKSS
jgi:cytochrome c556